jgi:hypothetical protein
MADNVSQLLASVGSNGSGAPSVPAAAPPQAIQIINRVPRVLLDIIQQQFSLMQQWLQPLYQGASAHDARVAQLEDVVQQTLQRYTELLKRLEDGKMVVSLKE